MKILLISPATDADRRTNKGLMMPQLALYILEGLTPKEHKVTIVEEETEPIDLDQDCDLVGISCMTANAPSPNSATGRASRTPLMPAAIIATISLSANSRLIV